MAFQDYKDSLASLARRDLKEHVVNRDYLEHLDPKDWLDLKVLRERLASKERRVTKERAGFLDLLVYQVLKVLQASPAVRGLEGPRGSRVPSIIHITMMHVQKSRQVTGQSSKHSTLVIRSFAKSV
uniref:Uncharacterized protein n=1 Tax=Hanusia phi TaxID=3032 RepID=A0A7S0I295_9CRYP|mmetsp:Transcript_8372/g.19025  ORF Transcript_8372/g.19025 Transcript_8372/m.19025 type:complete len:126 (+) Transcript_8372:326-703(+)